LLSTTGRRDVNGSEGYGTCRTCSITAWTLSAKTAVRPKPTVRRAHRTPEKMPDLAITSSNSF
jgi:hypothetical protein